MKLTGTFLDVLTDDERAFYLSYRADDIHTYQDNHKFNVIWKKKCQYVKDTRWAKKLAVRVVNDNDPWRKKLANDVLYSAMVWGKTH